MPQPGRGQVEAALSVGEGPDDLRPAPYLLHDPLQRIVGAYFDPVGIGEGVKGKCLADTFLDQVGSLAELFSAQLRDHGIGLGLRRFAVLLSVNSLEFVADLPHLG